MSETVAGDRVALPPDIEEVIERSWQATKGVPGFLGGNEARFRGIAAACAPARGTIVVMLGKLAAHYGLGPIVSIDPHTHNLSAKNGDSVPLPSTYDDFLSSLRQAGVENQVEVHREFFQ